MKVTLNLEKRYVYVIISLILIATCVLIVNALTPGTPANPGHDINSVSPPSGCNNNQVLQWNSATALWQCSDLPTGSGLSCRTVSSDVIVPPETTWKTVEVKCNLGEMVTGGGFSGMGSEVAAASNVIYSEPMADGWRCKTKAGAGWNTDRTCYAICCQ